MRALIVATLSVALIGCQRQALPVEQASASCAHSATHQITFSDPAAFDTVTARAEGPTCAQAVVTLVVRNANGDPLLSFASTFTEMNGGPGAHAGDADVDRFLSGWADVTLKNTGDLPEWRADAASLGASVEGMSYATPFDRGTYEQLRLRNLPELCFAAGAESSQCIIMDPASSTPSRIVSFGA